MKYHKLKSSLLKVLDKMPGAIGYYIYHQIQKAAAGKIEPNIKANQQSFEKIATIFSACDKSIGGKNILEIGSGWMPLMPYLFKCLGKCNNVYTYDINEHYNKEYISRLNSYFKINYHTDFENGKTNKYHLPDFVKYHPKQNVITAGLPQGIDIIFSRFVLEHVSPDAILAMHQRFYKEIAKDSVIIHLISPSDHRAYSDSSLSHYDFLKYSQSEWDKIQTKFDYHNRLRLPQYLEIFEKSGFEIVHLEYSDVNKASSKYNHFKKLTLHSNYTKFIERDVLASSINVLLKKK